MEANRKVNYFKSWMKGWSVFLALVLIFLATPLFANINEGLIAYYPFNGNANDESGNNHNGVVHGAALTADRFGRANSAYEFNGTSDYIQALSSSSLNPGSGSFTYAFWIKTRYPQLGYIVGRYDQYSSSNVCVNTTWGIQFNNAKTLFAYNRDPNSSGSCSQQIININALDDGNYHFIAVVRDKAAGLIRYYIDGSHVVDQTDYSKSIVVNTPLKIGTHGTWNTYYKGAIDDIRIYNRAITEAEVQELYIEQPPVTGTADLVVQDISRDQYYYYVTYCNRGTTATTGTLTVSITNVASGQSFQTNPLYPYSVPEPGTCMVTGGITCGLIGDTSCTAAMSVSAYVDDQNTVPESNETNNSLTKTFSASN
ncbi:MAG: hypothetical protein HQK99_14175 [Nitrospirae bacterium]|nr:hypothetical protein [Nitrospirota bacterium]